MYLSILKIWNFRKYGVGANDAPGIEVHFQDGVNVLIGENDSGKTAIIDAIRYVLHTKSGETIYFDEKDFHKDGNIRARHLRIECILDGISEIEAAPFLEWIGLIQENGKTRYCLRLTLNADLLDDGRIYPQFKAGMGDDGSLMDGKARDLLRVVYLKPLRDALQDMTHGYKSRIAQILQAHSIFGDDKKDANGQHELEVMYQNLKTGVEEYFTKKEKAGYQITENINDELIKKFLLSGDSRKANLKFPQPELINILRQLDLILEDNKSGLGSLNLLCVAAELLLFLENKRGLKLTLIEELEAHLHPQYQLRLMDYIKNESRFGQFILTTHSITLGANIDLEKLVVLKDNRAFPMSAGYTECSKPDYEFLHRFLDATKANLFFAKGVMMVEGDAENLLIPSIADVIGMPIHEHGVSIVNVGSTAYKRYAKIFQRRDCQKMGTPVAILTDLDVRSIEYYDDPDEKKEKKLLHVNAAIKTALGSICPSVDFSKLPDIVYSKSELQDYLNENKSSGHCIRKAARDSVCHFFDENISSITEADIEKIRNERRTKLVSQFESDEIKVFVPQCWTLEYEIAQSGLFKALAMAIEMAKAEQKGIVVELDIVKNKIESRYIGNSDKKIAYELFKPINDGLVSKAIVAQYLARIFEDDKNYYKTIIETDVYLQYIVNAIKHVVRHG